MEGVAEGEYRSFNTAERNINGSFSPDLRQKQKEPSGTAGDSRGLR